MAKKKLTSKKAKNGIEGTMGGLTDIGFNYNGAWGGTMQDGGLTFLEPTSRKLPKGYVIPYNTPSTELAMSIGGVGNEPAYLIPSFKYGRLLEDPISEFRKTGEHLGGPFKTYQEADEWERTVRHPYVEKGQSIPTPLKRWGKDFAMGGSLPGAVGFTYARVAGAAPDNGPYAKKTKASAQDGTYVKKPRTDMLTMDEYRLQQALANQPQVAPSSKPIDIEERNRKNKAYAQKYGRKYNERTGAVEPLVSPSTERTMNRVMENIVAPSLLTADVMLAAPIASSAVKSLGKSALTKIGKKAVTSPNKGILGAPPNEIRVSESIFGMTPEQFAEYNASERLPDVDPTVRIGSIREFERAIEDWGSRSNISGGDLPSRYIERFQDIGSRYNINLSNFDIEQKIRSLSPIDKSKFLTDIYREFPTRTTLSELTRERAGRTGGSEILPESYGRATASQSVGARNISGLTKEEVLKIAPPKDKEVISKMTEDEFRKTVTKPTGEVVPYYQGDLMPQFTGKQNVEAISPNQYTDLFNANVNRLNEIIAGRNKSGVEYRVKELSPSGQLIFETPEQVIVNANRPIPQHYLDAFNKIDKPGFLYKGYGDKLYFSNMDGSPGFTSKQEAKEWITDIIEKERGTKIKSGESTWSVGINPGKWEGEVEDIASSMYYRSIPGLDMRNTGASVFSDRTPRRGTGAYESINEYLKELGLGRVKPGFNSQTEYSRGLWENAVKKGKAFGFYNDPRVVYGSMRSLLPYAGLGALGAGAIEQKRDGGEMKYYQEGLDFKPKTISKDGSILTPYGQWEYPGEITTIPSNEITMQGVPYPVLGISDEGDVQMMYPGEDYTFDGKSVTEYPMMQGGGSLPTRGDSLRVYNAQLALNNFYNKEVKAGRLKKSTQLPFDVYPKIFDNELTSRNLEFYRETISDRKRRHQRGGGYFDDQYKKYFNLTPEQVKKLENQGLGITKSSTPNVEYYRDLITPMQNLASPFAIFDKRIKPQRVIGYSPASGDVGDYPGGEVSVYDYDPLAVKPYDLRTPQEKIEWEKKYGKPKKEKPKPTSTPVKKTEPSKPAEPVKIVEQPKPVEKKQNVYEGTPVYSATVGSGGPSALVGFANQKGDTTFIKPEDYERFGVPKYGREYIEKATKKFKDGGVSVNEADAQPIKKLDQLLNFTNYNDMAKAKKGKKLSKADLGQSLSSINTDLSGMGGIGGASTQLLGGIQQLIEEKKQRQKTKQFAALSDVAVQAATSRPVGMQRKYVRPEDMLVNPGETGSPYGTGYDFLQMEYGGMIGGNPTEIQNMYNPGDLYSDLGFEPLSDSSKVKQFKQGGKAFYGMETTGTTTTASPFNTSSFGALGQTLGSFAGGGGGQQSGAGQVGSAVGGIAGNILLPGVGGVIGSALGGAIGGVIGGQSQKKMEQLQRRAQGNLGSAAMQQSLQGQFSGYMEHGGELKYLSREWQPQVITKFGEYDMKDLLKAPKDADMLRAGGHLKSYTPPSERAMQTYAMGGELQTHWGGYAEPISENPYLPDGGETVMFRGQSHEESDSKGRTGIGVTYGDNPVEVERGEPAIKLKDGGTGEDSMVVFGNMIIPSYGVSELNDPKAKGMKFKRYAAELSKLENKANKVSDKALKLIDETDGDDQFGLLSLSTANAMLKGSDMKLKDAAMKKQLAAGIQSAILDTAEELGLENDALAKGKIKPAKGGGKFTSAQMGTALPNSYTDIMFNKFGPFNPLEEVVVQGVKPKGASSKSKVAKAAATAAPIKRQMATLDFTPRELPADMSPIVEIDSLKTTTPGIEKLKSFKAIQPEEDKFNVMDFANQLNPYIRPLLRNPLDPGQLAPEMMALATNVVEPVQAQQYMPMLEQTPTVSFQDQLNEIQAEVNATRRLLGNNPAAQAALFAQAAAAKNKVLGEQMKTNQMFQLESRRRNLDELRKAGALNIDILDRQATRQSQARSATKAQAQLALSSIADKIARNRAETLQANVMSNMYPQYTFGPKGRVFNTGLTTFNTPQLLSQYSSDELQKFVDAKKVEESKKKTGRNGSIVKAIKNL